MRKHRKLAVLKDDEIDRLERAGAACAGMDRAEVMDSMYNRLIPKPRGVTDAASILHATGCCVSSICSLVYCCRAMLLSRRDGSDEASCRASSEAGTLSVL